MTCRVQHPCLDAGRIRAPLTIEVALNVERSIFMLWHVVVDMANSSMSQMFRLTSSGGYNNELPRLRLFLVELCPCMTLKRFTMDTESRKGALHAYACVQIPACMCSLRMISSSDLGCRIWVGGLTESGSCNDFFLPQV